MAQPRVYLDVLPWDMRSRNTDWKYVRYALPRLAEFEHDLHLTVQQSQWITLQGNLKAVRTALGWRMGLPIGALKRETSKLAASELARSKCNVIFAQRAFPINAGAIPVVWENAIVDPEMSQSYGAKSIELEKESEIKHKLFSKATFVQVFSDAEERRHKASFPEVANRFVAVPWFAPHIRPCAKADLEKHRNASPVRILFVGNQAVRKGLDQLLAAFCQLPAAVQKNAVLTVISNFDRCHVSIPENSRIIVIHGAPAAQVMEQMRQAHIFVNVARFETYGVVFLEAMSQGNACLAPNWEVQRELFDYGKAGTLLSCEAASIRVALERLIEDEQARYAMAFAAWTRYRQEYAPAIVAKRYGNLFRSAVNR